MGGQRHTLRAMRPSTTACQPAGRWRQRNWNTVWWYKKKFVLGRLEQPRHLKRYQKNVGDCIESHNGSIDTTHTPSPFSFYNTFKKRVNNTPIACLQNKKKLSVSKFVPFIAGVIDIGDKTNFRISPRIFVNVWNGPWYTQGPGEHWFMKKNLESKISFQVPFNLQSTRTTASTTGRLFTKEEWVSTGVVAVLPGVGQVVIQLFMTNVSVRSASWRVKTSFCQKKYRSLYDWSLERDM